MSRPRDVNGNPVSANDTVCLAGERAHCDVVEVLAGAFAVIRWPDGGYTKEQTKRLRRLNQHPIRPTPDSMPDAARQA